MNPTSVSPPRDDLGPVIEDLRRYPADVSSSEGSISSPESHRPEAPWRHPVIEQALLTLSRRGTEPLATTESADSNVATHSECPSVATGAERRKFPRRPARGLVTVVLLPEMADSGSFDWERAFYESGRTGELLDVSRNGLSLLLLSPPVEGQELLVRLSRESREPLDARARVVRVSDIGDGRWKVIAQLIDELGFGETYEITEHERP